MADQKRDDSNAAASNAVRQAATRGGRPLILGADVDSEWNRHVKSKQSTDVIAAKLQAQLSPNMTHSGGGGARPLGAVAHRTVQGAASVDRIFDVPFSPFRNRFAVEQPQNRIEMLSRFRYYYRYEPLVRAAIDLHTEFPLSTFDLKHEDESLRQQFMDMSEELNLFEFLLQMASEYWTTGSAFCYGQFDDDKHPCVWKSFVLLNPLDIEMKWSPITDGRSNVQMRMKLNETIKTIVENGPRHKETGKLYMRIPSDYIDALKHGDGTIELNSIQASCFKRTGNYFSPYGESLLYSIMHLLAYRDKLRDSLYYSSDRHASPREIWKLGTDQQPASEEEILGFRALLESSWLDPNAAMVWNHAVQHEYLGAAEKMLPVSQEITKVEEEMLIGLMLNKGFLDASYGAYANMSVSLDVLISRYLTFRTRLERWIQDYVFAPLCRIHNIYKPTQAELAHKIRIKNARKRPWVPEVSWSKQELRDTNQKIQLLMQFRDKLGMPGFPRDRMLELVGENPAQVKAQLRKERIELQQEGSMAGGQKPVQMGGPGLEMGGAGPALGSEVGLDMSTGLEGGEGPAVGQPGAPIPAGQGAPPESMNAQTNTGAPGVAL